MTRFMIACTALTLLTGCATDTILMPRGTEPGIEPWGYEDMCNDPGRRDPFHCPEEDDDDI